MLQRLVAEARAGRFEADLVDNNVAQVEALHREYLLQRVESPQHAHLIADAVPAHKEWVGNSIDMIIQGYNSNQIRQEDLPKSYQDLLNPKWKGQLGVEATDQHWFAAILEELGYDAGMNLFKRIGARRRRWDSGAPSAISWVIPTRTSIPNANGAST